MTAVFSMRGWGQLSAAIVSTVVVSAFKAEIQEDVPKLNPIPLSVDSVWRLIIGLGCVPAAIALYARLTIPESPRFTMDIARNVHQAAQDINVYLTPGPFGYDAEAVRRRAEEPRASRRDFVA
jgi:PHS family inorganic phosphate transporter-like MFS transporter